MNKKEIFKLFMERQLDMYYKETGKIGLWDTGLYTEAFIEWQWKDAAEFIFDGFEKDHSNN